MPLITAGTWSVPTVSARRRRRPRRRRRAPAPMTVAGSGSAMIFDDAAAGRHGAGGVTRLQGRHGSSRESRRHAAGQRRRRWSQPPAVPAAGRLIRGAWPGRSAARSGQWLPAAGRGRAAEPIITDRRRRGASGGGVGTRPMSTPRRRPGAAIYEPNDAHSAAKLAEVQPRVQRAPTAELSPAAPRPGRG